MRVNTYSGVVKVSGRGGGYAELRLWAPAISNQKIGLWHDCDTARYKQPIQMLRFTNNYFKKSTA